MSTPEFDAKLEKLLSELNDMQQQRLTLEESICSKEVEVEAMYRLDRAEHETLVQAAERLMREKAQREG